MFDYIDLNYSDSIKELLYNKKIRLLIETAVNLTVNKPLVITYGGEGSYTDGKTINIGIFDFLDKYDNKTILFSLIALALHEAQHTVSSDFKILSNYLDEFDNEFDKKLAANISNCIEDGRIEYIHKKRFINNIKFIKSIRNVVYNESITVSDDCIINKIIKDNFYECDIENLSLEELYRNLNDDEIKEFEGQLSCNKINNIINAILQIATTNKLPLQWDTDTDINSFIELFIDDIKKTVKSNNYQDVCLLTTRIIDELKINYNSELQLMKQMYDNNEKVFKVILGELLEGCGENDNVCLDGEFFDDKFIGFDDELYEVIDKLMDNKKRISNKKDEDRKKYFKKGKCSPFKAEVKILKIKAKELVENNFCETTTNLQNGSIDRKRLWRLVLNDNYIMQRKTNLKTDKIAIYLLVDCSGSMEETVKNSNLKRIDVANKTSAIIEEAFCEYVNLEIAFFNNYHNVVRSFDEDFNNFYVWKSDIKAGGGNCDYENIKIAVDVLKKRNENKKIILILSDGLPCSEDYKDDPIKLVREEVKEAKKNNIEVIALSLDNNEDYTKMYDHILQCNSDNLNRKLCNLILRLL